MKRYNNPALAGLTDEERFWRQVERGRIDECWPWTGTRTPQGYGTLTFAKKTMGSHRVSWMLHHGDIPDGRFICHHCDNPPCVNPAHLFLGTPQDNTTDMLSKGRWVINYRDDTLIHKDDLTPPERQAVRQRFLNGAPVADLAAVFCTDETVIWRVIRTPPSQDRI